MGALHSGTLLTTPQLQGWSAGIIPSEVWMLENEIGILNQRQVMSLSNTLQPPPSTIQLRPHYTPPSRKYAPDIGLFVALRVLVLVCLLRNRNAESKKNKRQVM